MTPGVSQRAFVRDALGIAMLVTAALALNRLGADLGVADLAYDAAARAFRWREHPLLTSLLHDGARWLAATLLVALVVLLAASRHPALRPWRPALAFMVVGALAAAGTVALLKSLSTHSCPWDLARYGGSAAFFPFLGSVPPDPGPGRCTPSGHASTGFMWIPALYALRRSPFAVPRRDALRCPVAAGVIAFGAAVSLAQVARGAHFLSHTLLTAALCWAVALALDRAWPTQRG